MGISLSKPPQNPLIQDDNFDGEGGDNPVTAENYQHDFGPEWILGPDQFEYIERELQDLNQAPSKLDLFSMKGQLIVAKPYSVYDGDTANFIFKFNDHFARYRFRMIGYNTPEIRSPDPKEKERAIKARDYLANRINGKKCLLYLGDFDKYGRPLCDIYLIEDENNLNPETIFNCHINSEMIAKGYGVPYNPRDLEQL